nr:hypothetical protein BaRGS_015122 [Batillaria attramentaria]
MGGVVVVVACLVMLSLVVVPSDGVVITTDTHWAGGFQGTVLFNVTQNLDGWTMHFVFDQPVYTFFTWQGLPENVSEHEVIVNSTQHNALQERGATVKINFIGHANGTATPDVCVFIEEIGNDDCNDSVIDVQGLPSSASKDYADALRKSILFYTAQRSGQLPADNQVHWRWDSALEDCVTGGWYDGGDHVKFSLPMASATTLLLWGLTKFKAGYVAAGQLDQMYDSVSWPLDYLQRTWDAYTQQLVVQVGEVTSDHAYWGRPEDMTMYRPCFKVGPDAPGSDVAGQAAAALALGAIVFHEKGGNLRR